MRWALPLILALLVADGIYCALRAASPMFDMADHLVQARASLNDSDYEAAETELRAAADGASTVRGLRWHPAYFVADLLPWIGQDVSAVTSLSNAAGLTADAGIAALEGAREAGFEENELAETIYADGRVRFAPIHEVSDHARVAATLLDRAVGEVEDSPRSHFNFVNEKIDLAVTELASASESAKKVSALLGSFPDLFAEDGQRSYLLAFQTPSEARATGGLAGFYGVLEARDGRISLDKFDPYYRLDLASFAEEGVDAPDWFRAGYVTLSSLDEWQMANLSPTFPAVADVMLKMYERAAGDALDGVIAMDPIAMESMLPAINGGKIDARGLGPSLTPDNIRSKLMHDSYTTLDPNAQNAYLKQVIRGFWAAVESGDLDPKEFVQGLQDAVRTQHLKMFVRSGSQKAVEEMGLEGDPGNEEGHIQMVFNNNISFNKVDYFLHKSMRTEVELNDEGTAEVTLTATLDNRAPNRPPSVLLGPALQGDPPGMNRLLLHMLLPEGAEVVRSDLASYDGETYRYLEGGRFPVVYGELRIPAGTKVTASVTYRLEDVFVSRAGRDVFELTTIPQPSANQVGMSLIFRGPGGTDDVSRNLDETWTYRAVLP